MPYLFIGIVEPWLGLPFPPCCGNVPVCGPSETAFTFVDYEQDWAGVAESLTWSQLYRRTLNVAQELKACGSIGDRAVILAPQGLEYVVAFLGALQAGQIAVPLSMPLGGASDERVSAVLRDASPSSILTTSSVAGKIAESIKLGPGECAPSVIEVDLLDLDSEPASAAEAESPTSIAHLQYTSGSTRTPAGVVVSHRNIQVNIEQLNARLLRGRRGGCSAGHHCGVVAAVLSRHGFDLWNRLPGSGGISRRAHQSAVVPAATSAVDATAGKQQSGIFGRAERCFRIGGPKNIR